MSCLPLRRLVAAAVAGVVLGAGGAAAAVVTFSEPRNCADPVAGAVAAAARRRRLQPRIRQPRRHRARRAAVRRPVAVGQRRRRRARPAIVRHAPSPTAPRARGIGHRRSQYAVALQRRRLALVRLGRCPRQPVGAKLRPMPTRARWRPTSRTSRPRAQRSRAGRALSRGVRRAPPRDDERVAVDAAKAIAAYQETLVTSRTSFDDFRDALARGDMAAARPLSRARATRPRDLRR